MPLLFCLLINFGDHVHYDGEGDDEDDDEDDDNDDDNDDDDDHYVHDLDHVHHVHHFLTFSVFIIFLIIWSIVALTPWGAAAKRAPPVGTSPSRSLSDDGGTSHGGSPKIIS